ncbi:MAG: Hsp33 family molecular chaperone HslO [Cyanobacteria bacterium NC_groundwater_1444_Ag_S-0.65um_54_12]|nr:Hsp33 family molecular chaperone HslO [Cyanobacteria bacterium NC_groundwater_1444_Ag_S-0.65um_54_12]
MASSDNSAAADSLLKLSAAGGRIRGVVALTTHTVEEARQRHQTSVVATAALGKALTGGLLLSAALMKHDGRLTIRVVGGGPLGGIIVDAGADGSVRGYVAQHAVDIPLGEHGKLDVGSAVGREGFIFVTHDAGNGHPYTGVVELVSGELGEDFTHYLAVSEQIPAAISLGIFVEPDGRVSSAGGLLFQLLPDAGDEIAWRLEQNILALPSFTQLAHHYQTTRAIAEAALVGFQSEILAEESLRFYCHCSVKRALNAILTLGKAEIRAMIVEEGKAEVRCHFCNEIYHFAEPELLALLEADQGDSGEQLFDF